MRRPGSSRIKPAESEDSLLIGWKEISRYMRKGERALQRWVTSKSLPVVRINRTVCISRSLIDTWLLSYAQVVRRRMAQAQLEKLT